MRPSINRTNESEYKFALLSVLFFSKTSRTPQDIVERVRIILEAMSILNPCDYEYLDASGQKRYYNTCCWARKQLKDDGYLRGNSKHGIWELSEKGTNYMKEMIRTKRFERMILALNIWMNKNKK